MAASAPPQAIPKGGLSISQIILLCYADVGARNISGFPTAAQNQFEMLCLARRALFLMADNITPYR
jgi:hypothetical protein